MSLVVLACSLSFSNSLPCVVYVLPDDLCVLDSLLMFIVLGFIPDLYRVLSLNVSSMFFIRKQIGFTGLLAERVMYSREMQPNEQLPLDRNRRRPMLNAHCSLFVNVRSEITTITK